MYGFVMNILLRKHLLKAIFVNEIDQQTFMYVYFKSKSKFYAFTYFEDEIDHITQCYRQNSVTILKLLISTSTLESSSFSIDYIENANELTSNLYDR